MFHTMLYVLQGYPGFQTGSVLLSTGTMCFTPCMYYRGTQASRLVQCCCWLVPYVSHHVVCITGVPRLPDWFSVTLPIPQRWLSTRLSSSCWLQVRNNYQTQKIVIFKLFHLVINSNGFFLVLPVLTVSIILFHIKNNKSVELIEKSSELNKLTLFKKLLSIHFTKIRSWWYR